MVNPARAALDLALEDVISADRGGRRRGKGGDGLGKASRPVGDEPAHAKKKEKAATAVKLEMSLEDVIAKEVRPRGKGKSKGRDRSAGEWRSKKGDKGHGRSSSTKRAWQVAGRKIWGGAKSQKDSVFWSRGADPDEEEREAGMVWVGGCPGEITEEGISKVFAKHGPVEEIIVKHSARATYAFVVYANESDAHKAINALNETEAFGVTIKVVARKGFTGKRKGGGKGNSGKAAGKGYGERRDDRRDEYRRPSRRGNADKQQADDLKAENARLEQQLAGLKRTVEKDDWKKDSRREAWNGGSRASGRSSGGSSHRAERESKAWISAKEEVWSGDQGRGARAKERRAEEPPLEAREPTEATKTRRRRTVTEAEAPKPRRRVTSTRDAPERGSGGRAAGTSAGHERGTKRGAREYDYPPAASGASGASAGGRKRIKVSNLPRGLGWRDIKDSFEREAGKVDRCEVEGNQAWITFTRTEDARTAVKTFDGGELNDRKIAVTLEA